MTGTTSLPRPTGVRWIVFTLACGTSWTLYLHRYTLGLIKPKLVDEFGWQPQRLGVLDSCFLAAYAGFQVPAGLLVDLLGAHVTLSAFLALGSLALALETVAGTFFAWQLVLVACGAAQAGVYPALSRATRLWFPASTRTSVQGWVAVFFGRMGGASANLLFASLFIGLLGLDWRTSLLIFAAWGGLLTLAFALLFRDAPAQHPWTNAAERDLIAPPVAAAPVDAAPAAPGRTALSAAGVFSLVALIVQTSLSTVADNIFSNWIPLYLAQVHQLKFAEMGLWSMLPLLGGALGGVAGGMLNDFVFLLTKNRGWSRSAVGLAGKGIAAALLAGAIWTHQDRSPYGFCVVLMVIKFFSDWSLASTWGTITDVGGRATATVFAINNAIGSGAGALAPLLFGWLAQYYGWPSVFLTAAGFLAVCASSWMLVNANRPLVATRD